MQLDLETRLFVINFLVRDGITRHQKAILLRTIFKNDQEFLLNYSSRIKQAIVDFDLAFYINESRDCDEEMFKWFFNRDPEMFLVLKEKVDVLNNKFKNRPIGKRYKKYLEVIKYVADCEYKNGRRIFNGNKTIYFKDSNDNIFKSTDYKQGWGAGAIGGFSFYISNQIEEMGIKIQKISNVKLNKKMFKNSFTNEHNFDNKFHAFLNDLELDNLFDITNEQRNLIKLVFPEKCI